MHHRILPWLAILIASLTPAFADEYELLTAQLIAAGTNEFEDERHTVEIEDCLITTYRWKNLSENGWTLWSSFNFHISDVALGTNDPQTGESFIYAPHNGDVDDPRGIVVITFEARGDILVRHERSTLRDPTPTERTGPSPRGDGRSYYYEWRPNFFIIMQGPYVQSKGVDFTRTYARITAEFCSQIG